jgi:hypothetical protein
MHLDVSAGFEVYTQILRVLTAYALSCSVSWHAIVLVSLQPLFALCVLAVSWGRVSAVVCMARGSADTWPAWRVLTRDAATAHCAVLHLQKDSMHMLYF